VRLPVTQSFSPLHFALFKMGRGRERGQAAVVPPSFRGTTAACQRKPFQNFASFQAPAPGVRGSRLRIFPVGLLEHRVPHASNLPARIVPQEQIQMIKIPAGIIVPSFVSAIQFPLSSPLSKSAGFGEGRSSASIHQKILPLRPCATSRCPLKNIKDRNAGGGLLRERGERMNGELFRGTKEGTIIPAGFLVIWGCSLGTIRGERFGACGSRSSDRRRND